MFHDRYEAGKSLSHRLIRYKNKKDALVLGIPRGGIVVASVLAQELNLPLEVALSKKIGYPGNEEYAIGAVTLFGEIVDENFKDKGYIRKEVSDIRKKLNERYERYVGKRSPSPIKGKTIILVDDGVATGKTIFAFLAVVKKEKPKKVIVAIPVGPQETVDELKGKADEVICLEMPENFYGIGQFYEQFEQVDDEEVVRLLRR